MTDPTPDIPLLRKVVELAEDEVRKADKEKLRGVRFAGVWNQMSWFGIEKSNVLETRRVRKSRSGERRTWLVAEKLDCSTTGCIAGHACLINGDKPVIPVTDLAGDNWEYADWEDVLTTDGKVESVMDRARVLLGLNYTQSNNLFAGGNTIKDVRRIAEQIARQAGDKL